MAYEALGLVAGCWFEFEGSHGSTASVGKTLKNGHTFWVGSSACHFSIDDRIAEPTKNYLKVHREV
ncbi:hypothetical protein CQ019_08575 [Arthrobacter sp. MYb229]|nr:hypothetical protein CQ019_08575 [Arthrobacter sp. MYb229]PRB51714.1 hypothetical protein CQ013_07990 [Arthrobacter sp. MYb216]